MPTKIEWVKGSDGMQGETWNPIIAVLKADGKRGWFCVHADASCTGCYAERQNVAAHWGGTGLAYTFPNLEKVNIQIEPKVLEKPLHWKRPRKVFPCSMTDLFGSWVPAEFIIDVFEVMDAAKQHTYQVLTKRPERIEPVLYGPEGNFYLGGGDLYHHIWLGFSAGDQKNFDERWQHMKPLAEAGWTTWVSLEPLISPVALPKDFLRLGKWCVTGGESGPKARPMQPAWLRAIRDQCQGAQLPHFFKQWGDATDFGCAMPGHAWHDAGWDVSAKRHGRILDGRTWDEFPRVP